MESPAELLGQLISTMNQQSDQDLIVLPTELVFLIITHLQAYDLSRCARVCRLFKDLCDSSSIWRSRYIERWLPQADIKFLESAYKYRKNEDWKKLFQTRFVVERKYNLTTPDKSKHSMEIDVENSSDGSAPVSPTKRPQWKEYFDNGNKLAQMQTDDVTDFVALASIEREQYISAAAEAVRVFQVQAAKQKKFPVSPYSINAGAPALDNPQPPTESDAQRVLSKDNPFETIDPKHIGDIYYFWGRSIKDVAIGLKPEDDFKKVEFLLDEADRYDAGSQYDPTDAYVHYSWAINLRFQLEYASGKKEHDLYKVSSQKYKDALRYGYAEKFIRWGLGSLKLHMARKHVMRGDHTRAALYLDKAEKKYQQLWGICDPSDVLTVFSLRFNHSCIASTRAKIFRAMGLMDKCKDMLVECSDRLQSCATEDFRAYLTLDLLDLWYFDEFRNQDWFKIIYKQSQPKKLSASY